MKTAFPEPAGDGKDYLRARVAGAKTRLGRAAIGGALLGLVFLALWALAPPVKGRLLTDGRRNVFAMASFVGFVAAGFCLMGMLAKPTGKPNDHAFDSVGEVAMDYVEDFEDPLLPTPAGPTPPAAGVAPEAPPRLPAPESRLVRVRWLILLWPLALAVILILGLVWMPELAGKFAIFAAAAVAAFVVNAHQASFQYSLARKGAIAKGKATGFVLENRMGYEFGASDGHLYTGEIRLRPSPDAPKPGSPVFVLYDPDDPNRNLPLPRLTRVEIGTRK